MTSASLFRERDRVAVSTNGFKSFSLGRVRRVLGNGLRVVLDSAVTHAERKGSDIHSSHVRFAYQDQHGTWVAERHRRPDPPKEEKMPDPKPQAPAPATTSDPRPARVAAAPEIAPIAATIDTAPFDPKRSAAEQIRDTLKSRGLSLDDMLAVIMEAKRAEDVEREIDAAEHDVLAAELASAAALESLGLADKRAAETAARKRLAALKAPR